MNKVKVHPHKTLVNSGVEACVSITPDKKHGRAYYMGARQDGDVLGEHDEQIADTLTRAIGNMVQVTYHFNSGRFIAADGTDVTDGSFKAALFVGRDFYISKEW